MSTGPERVTIGASPPNVDEAGKIGPCAMDVTARLARFAATLDHEDMPADLRERTRMAVLDGLGIMLGAVDFARTNGDDALERYPVLYLRHMTPIRWHSEFSRLGAWCAEMLKHHERRATTPRRSPH